MSRTWSDSDLIQAVKESSTMTDVLQRINIRRGGGSFKLVRGHVERLGLDISHFRKASDRLVSRQRLDPKAVFVENSVVSHSSLRRVVIRENAIPMVCAVPACGNTGTHLGKPLSLQLDHKNGVDNDNRLENLRWMCPNCHTQTKTYSRIKYKEKVPNEPNIECAQCDKKFWRKVPHVRYYKSQGRNAFCSLDCKNIHQKAHLTSRTKPTREELSCLILEKPATDLAKMFKVSGRAIKKWCDQYGIKTPGPGAWAKRA